LTRPENGGTLSRLSRRWQDHGAAYVGVRA
jgi:hypothetical protein